MTNRVTIKITANFERNLADIEQFLIEAEAPQAFDVLIDELLGTVLPNLEQFPNKFRQTFFQSCCGFSGGHQRHRRVEGQAGCWCGQFRCQIA
ncbi:hypothetical protein [Extensimonas vulgaris]|uniref:ParE-like toxin of type II ParDE toxin-antitoxin system n=1 Tax=Extensimonas vulgaris TaxID=1031594 RepID=A0A369AJQ0_9BURK|nr:hypothetical protein DFR45_1084 [Extensimonas vulgaris]TWI34865.1 hypothetical protein IP95_02588 [Extensimonas vulgaris]